MPTGARNLWVPLALLGATFFVLPLVGLLVRVPFAQLGDLLDQSRVREALALSMFSASASLLLALAFGFPLAWVLARHDFPGRSLLRALVTLPMVLPPVVAGVALLSAFGRRGLIGDALSALGLELPFTTIGVVVAATFVSAPFLIVTLEAALHDVDRRVEQAAATLGATPLRILWTVTLPSIRGPLLAGLALTWARALGEFGATITFAGNLQGHTQTMPLAVYETLQDDQEAALLLSLLLLFTSTVIFLLMRGRLIRP